MFASKARSLPYLTDASLRLAPALPANIRLGQKGLLGIKTSLLLKFVNYGGKYFHRIGPRTLLSVSRLSTACHFKVERHPFRQMAPTNFIIFLVLVFFFCCLVSSFFYKEVKATKESPLFSVCSKQGILTEGKGPVPLSSLY